jgi:plasmid maintenance system antidote protein VapI
MSPATIRLIVDAAGGVDAFAAAIRVKPRHVYYLLAGKRNLSPRTEELARNLAEELGVEIQG